MTTGWADAYRFGGVGEREDVPNHHQQDQPSMMREDHWEQDVSIRHT
jgi:hypothetical protein